MKKPVVEFATFSLKGDVLHGETGDILIFSGSRSGVSVFRIMEVDRDLDAGEIRFSLKRLKSREKFFWGLKKILKRGLSMLKWERRK